MNKLPDGFGIVEPRRGGDAYESDAWDKTEPLEAEADGWLAFGAGEPFEPRGYKRRDLIAAWQKGWLAAKRRSEK